MQTFLHVLYVGLRITVFLIGALLFGLDVFGAQQTFIQEARPFGLAPWQFGSLLVFVGLVWFIVELQITLWRFQNAQPVVAITAIHYIHREITLDVHNKGKKTATFSATSYVTIGNAVVVPPYTIPWQESPTNTFVILSNSHGTLRLCSVGLTGVSNPQKERLLAEPTEVPVHYLNLWKHTAHGSQQLQAGHHIQDVKPPEIQIRVSISSDPPAKGQIEWNYIVRFIQSLGGITIEEIAKKR